MRETTRDHSAAARTEELGPVVVPMLHPETETRGGPADGPACDVEALLLRRFRQHRRDLLVRLMLVRASLAAARLLGLLPTAGAADADAQAEGPKRDTGELRVHLWRKRLGVGSGRCCWVNGVIGLSHAESAQKSVDCSCVHSIYSTIHGDCARAQIANSCNVLFYTE